jgi:uncharacterized membrane protein
MADDGKSGDGAIETGNNVIAVSFTDDGNAYEALTLLKELDSQHQVEIKGAAVVGRSEDGQIDVKDQIGDWTLTLTAEGGLIGLVIGILGGPFGVLIGAATGVLIGSLFDIHDDDKTESVLADISTTVKDGRLSLLADVSEQSTEVIDTAMERLGGTVVRRSVDDVEAEIAASEKAQREAKREARKQLREARHEKQKTEIHAKIEEMKAKLHPHKQTEKTTA